MAQLKEKKIFFRQFTSYLVVLILPILILGFVVYSNFVALLSQQSNENFQKMLNQISNIMDGKLMEMTEISLKVTNKPEMSPTSFDNFYNVYRHQSMIAFQEGNSFLQEYAIYIRGGDYMYSGLSTYTLPMFFHFYELDDPALFREQLDSLKAPAMFTANSVQNARNDNHQFLIFLKPLPVNSSYPYGTAVFIVSEESIRDMYRSVITYRNSNVIILNEDRQVITSLNESPVLDMAQFSQIMGGELENAAQDRGGNKELRIDGQTYVMNYVTSGMSKWTYITIAPKEEVLASVNHLRTRAIIGLVIIFIVGVLAIYATMHLNYNPVKKLFRVIDKLTEKVEENRQVYKRQLLADLIRGHPYGDDEFGKLSEEAGLQLQSDAYSITVIDLTEASGLIDESIFQFWKSRLTEAGMEYYMVRELEPGKLAVILGTGNADTGMALSWDTWIRQFEEGFQQTAAIGVGMAYEDMNQMVNSYMEATLALQYQYVLGRGRVFHFGHSFSDITRSNFPYPAKDVLWIQQCLEEHNEHAYVKAMENISEQMMHVNMPLIIAKYICTDLLKMLFRKTDMPPVPSHADPGAIPDIISISRITSKLILRQVVDRIGDELQRVYMTEASASTNPKDHTDQLKMLQYVHTKYDDLTFSLQSMADHFQVTPAYMSKLFKDRTGHRLYDYVNQVRMEKASELLQTTDMPLQDIVMQIGYSDVSSFIRKFKKHYGVTPGEYRKR